jgi:hypothetical protein
MSALRSTTIPVTCCDALEEDLFTDTPSQGHADAIKELRASHHISTPDLVVFIDIVVFFIDIVVFVDIISVINGIIDIINVIVVSVTERVRVSECQRATQTHTITHIIIHHHTRTPAPWSTTFDPWEDTAHSPAPPTRAG